MAKSVKEAMDRLAATSQPLPVTPSVGGVNFKRTFTPQEWHDIETKRREMHDRLTSAD